jgi:Xaa-Pro aminopeptidase
MFQSFEARSDPTQGRPRLRLLRNQLQKCGVDGFILPRTDAHQNEYLAPPDERLAWLTGFTGSAGIAIILTEKAALFGDGRYTVQVISQVDTSLFEIVNFTDLSPADWLAANVPTSSLIGYDSWLHTPNGIAHIESAFKSTSSELRALSDNPIDIIRRDQPPQSQSEIIPHPLEYSGKKASEKIERLREKLADNNEAGIILSLGDSIAWTFNIRGSDIAHTPTVLAFAIVTKANADLFCNNNKITQEIIDWLAPCGTARSITHFAKAIDELGAQKSSIRIDPASTPVWIVERLKSAGAYISEGEDPVIIEKSRKNETEILGARSAHLRDGTALVRFLSWFTKTVQNGVLDEISVVKKLEEYRKSSGQLLDISFETIAGTGPNSAIVHYRVDQNTNQKIKQNSLFLIDSGAQYRDGTTDVTRTISVGKPSDYMCRLFTLVLKGHIAIATAKFPKGTSGSGLDALARTALWNAGYDFDHGTGHGVGSYLSVHEGPQGISKRSHAILEAGMLLSNEPGVYLEGQFGIRIENLLLVRDCEHIPHGTRPMHSFETLTLAPIDLNLIVPSLLSDTEINWLDEYHRDVLDKLAPTLDETERQWLEHACTPLRS